MSNRIAMSILREDSLDDDFTSNDDEDSGLDTVFETEDENTKGDHDTKCMTCLEHNASFCCFTCAKILCEFCEEKHNRNKQFDGHACVPLKQDVIKSIFCSLHSEMFESYCISCNVNICKKCNWDAHKQHRIDSYASHNTCDFEDAIKSMKQHYLDIINGMASREASMKNEIRKADEKIWHQQSYLHSLIDQQVKELRERLNTFQNDVVKKFRMITMNAKRYLDEIRIQEDKFLKYRQPLGDGIAISLKNLADVVIEVKQKLPSFQESSLPKLTCDFKPGTSGLLVGSLVLSQFQSHTPVRDGAILWKNGVAKTVSKTPDPSSPGSSELIWNISTGVPILSLDVLPNGDILSLMGGLLNRRIKVYSPSGKASATPFEVTYLKHPCSVAVHKASSTVAIADNHDHSIFVFSCDTGQWSSSCFHIKEWPGCVTFTPDGDILIGTDDARLLLKYTDTGRLIWRKRMQHDCYDLTCDDEGRIIILGDRTVYVYAEDLEELFHIPSSKCRTLLNDPQGVATDSGCNLFVSDWERDKVVMYDSEGNYIRDVVKVHGDPKAICLHSDNQLVVGTYVGEKLSMYKFDNCGDTH